MGCSHSKLDPDEELQARLCNQTTSADHNLNNRSKLKITHKNHKQNLNASAHDPQDECSGTRDDEKNRAKRGDHKALQDSKEITKENNDGKLDVRKIRKKGLEDDDLPGSPSFRFYFDREAKPKWMEEAAEDAAREESLHEMPDHKQTEASRDQGDNNSKSLNSSEASGNKFLMREKGSRFKGLSEESN